MLSISNVHFIPKKLQPNSFVQGVKLKKIMVNTIALSAPNILDFLFRFLRFSKTWA